MTKSVKLVYNKMKKIILVLIVVSVLFSCQKEAGEGGTSSIAGKIITYDLRHFDVPGGNLCLFKAFIRKLIELLTIRVGLRLCGGK